MVQCQRCRQPALRVYARSGQTFQLCERCFDRYQVQDAYEQRLLELERLTRQGNYETALTILHDISDAYSSCDHDGWLENTILLHKALIFAEQGKHDDALKAYRIRAQRHFAEPSDFMVNQLAIARTLDQLGKPAEAISELECGLDAVQGASIPTALSLLVQYAKIAEQQRQALPTTYKSLLEKVINYFGIKLPDGLLNDSATLSPAIIAAYKKNKDAQLRYEKLQEQLSDVKQKSTDRKETDIVNILRVYIENEEVGYYRDMARRSVGRDIAGYNP